jgi:hypothetical protein
LTLSLSLRVLCGHDRLKDSECQMEQCFVGMTDVKIVIVSNGTVLCGHDRLKNSECQMEQCFVGLYVCHAHKALFHLTLTIFMSVMPTKHCSI